MYKIKTSELLSEKGIVEELTSIEVVKNIYDDLFETKHHYLMAAYSLEYKIGNIELFFEEHKVDSLYYYNDSVKLEVVQPWLSR